MQFGQLDKSIRLFSTPLSARCGIQESPCQIIEDLESDHARLTETYKITLQEAHEHIDNNIYKETAKITTIFGVALAVFTFPVLFLGPVIAGIGLGSNLLVSGGFGLLFGHVCAKENTIPKLKQVFQTEVNWINSVYFKVNSAITEMPLFDQSASKTQLLMLKAHFDQVLQTSKEIDAKSLGASFRNGAGY